MITARRSVRLAATRSGTCEIPAKNLLDGFSCAGHNYAIRRPGRGFLELWRFRMWQSLTEIWLMPGVQIIVGLTVVFALIAVGWYIVVRLRGLKDQTQTEPRRVAAEFPRNDGEGGLSYQEYRMIETSLVKRRKTSLASRPLGPHPEQRGGNSAIRTVNPGVDCLCEHVDRMMLARVCKKPEQMYANVFASDCVRVTGCRKFLSASQGIRPDERT